MGDLADKIAETLLKGVLDASPVWTASEAARVAERVAHDWYREQIGLLRDAIEALGQFMAMGLDRNPPCRVEDYLGPGAVRDAVVALGIPPLFDDDEDDDAQVLVLPVQENNQEEKT